MSLDIMHMEWRDVAVVDTQAVIVATYTPSKNSFNLVKNELGIPVNIKNKQIEVDQSFLVSKDHLTIIPL
ncbi:hypothetical protein ACLBSQ_33490, partial [Klebsiella pneumoniae]